MALFLQELLQLHSVNAVATTRVKVFNCEENLHKPRNKGNKKNLKLDTNLTN